MRRGLISRSKAELPDAVLDARIARVRAAMGAAGLDALLLYTNNTRAAGVSWLTGFVPYWSEALLVVPRQGEPVLVVALTFRVKTWIERTSRVAGVVELDMLSAGIVDDLAEGGPQLTITDASALFAGVRAPADTAEVALALHA